MLANPRFETRGTFFGSVRRTDVNMLVIRVWNLITLFASGL
jgi:hypothetical protein